MKPYGYQCISLFSHQNDAVLVLNTTPKQRRFGFFFFFLLYSYIYSWLSVIIAFLKSLKSLTVIDLVDYQFLITDYEISYRLSVNVGYRLQVGYNRPR